MTHVHHIPVLLELCNRAALKCDARPTISCSGVTQELLIADYLYANSGYASLSDKNPMRIIKSLAVKWGDTGVARGSAASSFSC